MNPGEHTRDVDLFHEVLEQHPDRRAAFIEERHAGNPDLIQRLRGLLAGHERAQDPTLATSAFWKSFDAPNAGQAPVRVGPYRVLEVIGEGGMGVVYAAEQTEPIRRRVAVKVIKLGMDTKEVIARFEAERQALALMDHPGLARVLDAGVTDTGRPYFVMELVKGLPLTEYCRRRQLTTRQRLALFCDVCSAIQHAHQKGIIHRDLKPSNILVTQVDSRPVPKVIDFGVAKATAAKLTQRTVFTEQGRLIGTPEYMSPEQAEMSGIDVDTCSDIYSLGVILYELLTGVLPFDPDTLRRGGLAEVCRIIREVDPPKPSTRLKSAGGDHPRDPVIARSLRGDLDWIVMRAMDKDPSRRYETAGALRDDVERYLADQPVLAGPPGAAYRVRKFAKRHRVATAVAISAVLAGVIGVAGLVGGLVRAHEAEEEAEHRAENARALADFLQGMIFRVDPEHGPGDMPLLEAVRLAGETADEELGDHPEVEADVRESIGVMYRRRSMYELAWPHIRRSLDLRREALGEGHVETARSMIAMADLVFEHEGRNDIALDGLERARDVFIADGLGESFEFGWLMLDLGLVYIAADRLPEAERALRTCRELLSVGAHPQHPDISRPLRGLAEAALHRGDTETAERLARQAVNLCEGEDAHYIGARASLVLGYVLLELDRVDEAASILSPAEETFRRLVSPHHIRMAELSAVMSELCRRQGRHADALGYAEACLATRQALLAPEHWSILEAELLIELVRLETGPTDRVDARLLELMESAERTLGADHRLTIRIAAARAACAEAMGDAGLAEIRSDRLDDLKRRRAARLASGG